MLALTLLKRFSIRPCGVTSCHLIVALTTVLKSLSNKILEALRAPVTWVIEPRTFTIPEDNEIAAKMPM